MGVTLNSLQLDRQARKLVEPDAVRDHVVQAIYQRAERVAGRVVTAEGERPRWQEQLDAVLTSPWTGFPIMLLLLSVVFWLTVTGANYPSQVLSIGLGWLGERLGEALLAVGGPAWLHGILVMGVYRAASWVVAVMLPPMAIFFPLFSLFEDLGYLPRVAFNLDRFFRAAGAHGKQALTMCMGFGCNAAGVASCRIIESPRERLVAVLTNNFVPCNGRFPLLIALSLIFMGSSSFAATAMVSGTVMVGVVVTLTISWVLSRTILRGEPSGFVLELPPFRKPQVGALLARSFLDRTLFVLGRAVSVAAPAGAVIWILGNISVGGMPLLTRGAELLQPAGALMGMDGFILVAFILALPANELVIPILLMGYLSAGALVKAGGVTTLGGILTAQGWTWTTAVAVMLFSLLHYPCATTLLTMYRETGKARWAVIGALVPLGVAIVACLLFNFAVHLFA